MTGEATAPSASATAAAAAAVLKAASATAHEKVRLVMHKTSQGFGLGFKDRCVHKVKPGSASEAAGLMINDVILTVQGMCLLISFTHFVMYFSSST